jgi:hypothetical protein
MSSARAIDAAGAVAMYRELFHSERFSDITLALDETEVKLHKNVCSAMVSRRLRLE